VSRAIKLLLAEDSDDDERLVVRTLKRGGFDVQLERVQSAAAMTAAFQRQAWDAVISDYNMPGFSGLEALKILHATGQDIPFILISGTAGEELAVNALKGGASDYVLKKNLSRLPSVLERELEEAAIRRKYRKAQGELASSEHGLRQAQQVARLAHVITGPDGSFEIWSDTLPPLIGVEPAQMPGSTREWLDRVHPDDRAAFRAICIEAETKGTRVDVEYRLQRADGAWSHIRQVMEPLEGQPDPAGERRWFNTIQDVTEHKRAEQELRRFRAAMEASGDGILLVDRASMRYIDVNQTLCDMVGRARHEVIGMTPMELFSADRETLERDYDAIIADNTAAASKAEGTYRHKDGSLVPVETRRRALRTDDGWIIVGTARDITERRQAERELRESERRFSDMLGSIELVSLMLDTKSRITYCNDYLLRLTGWRREEVTGRNWFDLFIPPGNDGLRDVNAALLAADPSALHHENEIVTRSGERRLIRWNNSVLRSAAGDVVGIASIGEDITEQKRAEVRIKRLNRVYAMLSGVNTLIVRARNRDGLFEEACRIAVGEGGFHVAWIGIVDRIARKIVPVASAGADEELRVLIKELFSSSDGAPEGNTLTARVIREKTAVVSNDTRNDPAVLFGRKMAETEVRSMAFLPLIVSGEALGVLALYSGEAGFFDDDELKLLTELAGDIAFAIDYIDKQDRLDYLAYYDVLTGLANRSLFLERVSQHMRSAVSGGHKLALFFLDLERFRNINDSLGWPAGDALLKQVSEWLARNVGDANLLARVGSDHFAIVLPEVKPHGDVAHLLDKRIRALFGAPDKRQSRRGAVPE
jgi:PAS domain S-box-containing protein